MSRSSCFRLLMTALAFVSAIPASAFQAPQSAATAGPIQLIGRYRGMLPCADCSGIDTELAMYAKSPNEAVNTHYVLKRTYQKGRGSGKSFAESGSWTLLRGTPDDPDATVYQLTDSRTGNVTNYLKVGANQLEQLDKDQHRIDSKLNFRLTKVGNTTLANPAAQNCVAKGGKVDIREGKNGQYGVCVFPNGKECDEWALYKGQCSPTK